MSAIEKLINVCENRQVADTAQAELTTLRDELAQDRQAVAVLAGDLQSCQIENEKLIKELAQCRGELADAEAKAFAAVLCIRCIEHISVPQQNSTEFSGGECGACIAAERDALRNVLDAGKGQSAISILWEQNEKTQAERDTLKGEVERLRLEVVGWEHSGATAEVMNKTLCQSVKSHRLLLDEMAKAATIVLSHYDAGYSIEQKWEQLRAALTKYQQQCGEKVK